MTLVKGGGSRRFVGKIGEMLAVDHLKRAGFEILERNYTCPSGEIDIVAQEGPVLAFIEVRTRTSEEFGHPAESVDFGKRRRISRAAGSFMNEKLRFAAGGMRFDIIGIVLKDGLDPEIDLIRNAFTSRGEAM